MNLLDIKNLTIHYITRDNNIHAVNNVSLSIGESKTVGLVGETGAGKTTTALGILGLIPNPPGKILGGEILYNGQDLLKASDSELRKIRGNDISMIFQDPMTALNPIMRVGQQIAEVIRVHGNCSNAEAENRSLKMLETVGIPPERSGEYPHQFSGGMKQRVVIAMALIMKPDLLLADEPTTALDVTIQAQVLEIIRSFKDRFNRSMIIITHDLGIVAENCDTVAVIYAGQIVEFGTKEDLFVRPAHPYTNGLFRSLPSFAVGEKRLHPIDGSPPDPRIAPVGCGFYPRCPKAVKNCAEGSIPNAEVSPGHFCRCLCAEVKK